MPPKDLITTVYRTGYRLNPMYSETVADLDGNGVSMAQVAELRAVNEDLRRALERIQSTESELRHNNKTLAETQRKTGRKNASTCRS